MNSIPPKLTSPESAAIERCLTLADPLFDDKVALLRDVVGPAVYHTTLKQGTPVHKIRESAVYAMAVLEGPVDFRHKRAIQIVEALLPLQETDPSSDWRGIWPWFLEEPVRKMSPPDRNFADFVAVPFIQILKTDHLDAGLRVRTESALALAADAIRRRDVRLSYTNIAIMGIYACIAGGEILGDKTLCEHGRQKLRRFVEFTRDSQGFPEYNSPIYTVISLVELTRMLQEFTNEEDLHLAREIHDLAWQEIAWHWHAPSGEWGGPHGRSYSTLLQPNTRAFVEKGISGTVEEGVELPLDWAMSPVRCPDGLRSFFFDMAPRAHHVTVAAAGTVPLYRHTHHRPEFTLGSVERGTFWNQSRSLVGYAPGDSAAVAFTLRFLHDHYDFSAANLLCRQVEADVLGAICLAWDGGDKHPELDRFPEGRISASDWRARLELFNLPPDAIQEKGGRWIVQFGRAARLEFAWLEPEFGGLPTAVEVSHDENRTNLDLVLYHGPVRAFALREPFVCTLSFAMRISGSADVRDWHPPVVTTAESLRTLRWDSSSGNLLELQAPAVPWKEGAILEFARSGKPCLESL